MLGNSSSGCTQPSTQSEGEKSVADDVGAAEQSRCTRVDAGGASATGPREIVPTPAADMGDDDEHLFDEVDTLETLLSTVAEIRAKASTMSDTERREEASRTALKLMEVLGIDSEPEDGAEDGVPADMLPNESSGDSPQQ